MDDTLIADGDDVMPYLYGLTGDDVIIFGAQKHGLAVGGPGADYLEHTSGKGFLFADMIKFEDPTVDDGEDEWADVLLSSSSDENWMDGGAGDDILIVKENGQSCLAGGSGSDCARSSIVLESVVMGQNPPHPDGQILISVP
ncbi:hypothetical protein [Microbulbifer sp. DLAB2-AA]|uniref:hypothetical protein n=1 Tax=Microbulbifer sp. DLAB2-AA TaxID=3243394 RepID=UPI00403999C6